MEKVCCICLKTSKNHLKIVDIAGNEIDEEDNTISKCEICVSSYPKNKGLYCNQCYLLHLELHKQDALKLPELEGDNYIYDLQYGDETGIF